MNRLTIKNNDGTYSQPTNTTFEKLFYKVAEFEDFIEEMGFEDLGHLKTFVDTLNKYELGERKQFVKEINEREFFDMKEENEILKHRWQKLKDYVSGREDYNNEYDEDERLIEDNIIWTKMQELENNKK